MNKECYKCGTELTDENWYPSHQEHRIYMCMGCCSDKARQYRQGNRERLLKNGQKWRRDHGGRSMADNKDCTMFLGVHVAERVLSHVFKDVERLPYGASGYDFVCNRGKKVDVKSSCKQLPCAGGTPRWKFDIKKNTIPDYFLFLAFDNRDDLNPEHIWLMPGGDVNHLIGASISTTTLEQWVQHELDIDQVTTCCETMKLKAIGE